MLRAMPLIAAILCLVWLVEPVYGKQDYVTISTKTLKKMLQGEPKPLLAMTLSPIEFSMAHIPGSNCLPLELIANYYRMPEDPNHPIVFYCHGPG